VVIAIIAGDLCGARHADERGQGPLGADPNGGPRVIGAWEPAADVPRRRAGRRDPGRSGAGRGAAAAAVLAAETASPRNGGRP
jgi:hypothetical protein